MIPKEHGQPIKGFPSYYVTKEGQVWSGPKNNNFNRHGRFLLPNKVKNGYCRVALCRDGMRFDKFIHRLVLETFVGPCPPEMEARHLDNNTSNNNLINLCWSTHIDNVGDKNVFGTLGIGEKNNANKLSRLEVLEIRQLLNNGQESKRKIAKKFKVDIGTITNIQTGKTWSWLTDFSDYVKFVRQLGIQRNNHANESFNIHTGQASFELIHAILGIVTESGEIADIIKKHVAYQRPLDRNRILDEIGDLMFYIVMVAIECGFNFNEMVMTNIIKLKTRYPKGYNHQDANNRNIEAEQKAQMRALSPALSGGMTEEDALKAVAQAEITNNTEQPTKPEELTIRHDDARQV